MPNLLDDQSIEVLQDVTDIVYQSAPFSPVSGLPSNPGSSASFLRGYLMQPVSRGQRALVALASRRPEYRAFKIDLAGIIFTNQVYESRFKLRFIRDNTTWFDTDELLIEGLSVGSLFQAIQIASQSLTSKSQQTIQIPIQSMIGGLGHPTQHTLIQFNDDLYPSLPSNYKIGDMIDSKIGSWIFGIHRSALPQIDSNFDVQLLFSTDPDEPVQLTGNAVMTIHEVRDIPNNHFIVATDVMEVASPTPLTGGSKVALAYFEDVGYGIVSANAREYFYEQPNYPY